MFKRSFHTSSADVAVLSERHGDGTVALSLEEGEKSIMAEFVEKEDVKRGREKRYYPLLPLAPRRPSYILTRVFSASHPEEPNRAPHVCMNDEKVEWSSMKFFLSVIQKNKQAQLQETRVPGTQISCILATKGIQFSTYVHPHTRTQRSR